MGRVGVREIRVFPGNFPLIRLASMLTLQTFSHILETILQYPMWWLNQRKYCKAGRKGISVPSSCGCMVVYAAWNAVTVLCNLLSSLNQTSVRWTVEIPSAFAVGSMHTIYTFFLSLYLTFTCMCLINEYHYKLWWFCQNNNIRYCDQEFFFNLKGKMLLSF